MGQAPLIVVLLTLALRRNDETYHQAARFWAKIFGINFVLGVVTGIPMEFQFGTNWSHFSRFAGGVIGQTLAIGRRVRFFPRVGLPRPVAVRRKTARSVGPLVVGSRGVSWVVALGIFHHRHRCLDATSRRLRQGR